MTNKDIPDEATTKKFQKIIANAITDHIVDATKKVETPEEAAERYCNQFSWNDPREEDARDAFIAGVRWAEERSKK